MNKFKLNRKGVGELLKSEEMTSVLTEYATRVRDNCGPGFEISTYVGRTRANASVRAETFKARMKNSKHNTLLKALK